MSELEKLKEENKKLKAILAGLPNENDDTGSEYLHVVALKEKLNEAIKVIEFYACNSTWLCGSDWNYGDQVTCEDLEKNSPISKRSFVGGKRARQFLEKIKDINEKNN